MNTIGYRYITIHIYAVLLCTVFGLFIGFVNFAVLFDCHLEIWLYYRIVNADINWQPVVHIFLCSNEYFEQFSVSTYTCCNITLYMRNERRIH